MTEQELLKSYVHYDPDTGVFRYLRTRTNARKGEVAGCPSTGGYLSFSFQGRLHKAHRLAFLYMTGTVPEYVDHINGIRDDNRWCNLRAVTKTQNSWNRKANVKSLSGVKGVTKHHKSGRWMARVQVAGERKFIGLYDDIGEATEALEKARKAYHGQFANNGNPVA